MRASGSRQYSAYVARRPAPSSASATFVNEMGAINESGQT